MTESKQLVADGYFPVSNRHLLLRRVDPTRDARDVLYDAVKEHRSDARQWVDCLGEAGCREHFARVYSKEEKKVSYTLYKLVKAELRR